MQGGRDWQEGEQFRKIFLQAWGSPRISPLPAMEESLGGLLSLPKVSGMADPMVVFLTAFGSALRTWWRMLRILWAQKRWAGTWL